MIINKQRKGRLIKKQMVYVRQGKRANMEFSTVQLLKNKGNFVETIEKVDTGTHLKTWIQQSWIILETWIKQSH